MPIWRNAEVLEPSTDEILLVIDSWNIAEDDVEAAAEDEGPDAQNFQSFRIAFYNKEKNYWSHNHTDQRVRFKWYMVIKLPSQLLNLGFTVGEDAGIWKKYSSLP